MRRSHLQTAAAAAALAALVGVLWTGRGPGPDAYQAPPAAGHGRVVDEHHQPVPDAAVVASGVTAHTDSRGWFAVPVSRPALARVEAPGHTPRVVALDPRGAGDVELTSHPERTVVMRFGGDVMFGRRFYEPRGDEPPLLTDSSSVSQHAQLLDSVSPLLHDSDLSVVNLETPLITDPYWDPRTSRPPNMHPTKALAFASALASAKALAQTGVEAVSLGNNHSFDALGAGLSSTVAALDQAGVAHFGAGMNADQAWRPALLTRRGQRIALLGCTTVSGRAQPIPYVAGKDRPGAAECQPARLREEVTRAKGVADVVVVLIHGAVEYQRTQTPKIRALMSTAAAAGAAAVITSHPHVIGGVTQELGSVLAQSTGNLLFDQDLWSTFPSYLVRVDLQAGRSVHTTVDPIALADYRPVPTVGPLGQASARIAAGTVPGPVRLSGWGAAISAGPAPTPTTLAVPTPPGRILRLGRGWWAQLPASGPTTEPRAGTDLLYGTGTFEELDTDATNRPAPLWTLGLNARIASSAACSAAGSREDARGHGLELARSPVSTRDVFASPSHRIPVTGGSALSLTADLRRATDTATLELRWYTKASGASTTTTELDLPSGSWPLTACHHVRLDVTVPAGAIAVQPFARVKPGHDRQLGQTLALDNLDLVEWSGSTARGQDVIDTGSGGTITLHSDAPSGDGPLGEG
jgi:poly-gamma-glutamate capsule biosynthesis protein CapA/YwtB (metallophosphatase superfamily)